MPRTLLVIAGPTAVGKTALAISLAQQLNTSIISADSRQCYREMTIGTAKPSPEELAAVKHYFISSHSLEDHITAADFELLALQYLDEIFAKSSVAILCGGTGLYIKALCDGLDAMPQISASVEAEIMKRYEEGGIGWLQEEVKKTDPAFYKQAEIHNPARLLRALIFKLSTAQSITAFRTGQKKERDFRIIKVGLELPRELLYSRIDTRVGLMMEQGLLEEVKGLTPYYQAGTYRNKALATVGYAELFSYLDGNTSLNYAVDKIKQHSRNYAKRQLTWFKKDPEIQWHDARTPQLADAISHLL
jgi:tRNA dimethylallyltransferase